MIEISTETLIPIGDVPNLLPRRSNGRKVHESAVYRWVQRGVNGRRLEAVRIGGTTYTSIEALQRFGLQTGGHRTTGTAEANNTTDRQLRIWEEVERRLKDRTGRQRDRR